MNEHAPFHFMTKIAFIKFLFRTYIAVDNACLPQEGCEPLHYSACLMGRCSGCSTWCHSFPPPGRPPAPSAHLPTSSVRNRSHSHNSVRPSVRPLHRNESNATLTANGARERRLRMLPSRPSLLRDFAAMLARPLAQPGERKMGKEGREGMNE